jgi:hypothetical protein
MPPPLPSDFAWHPPSYLGGDVEARCLIVGDRWGTEVALISTCADGVTWHVAINRHLDWRRRGHGYHRDRGFAMRMVERWAAAHAARLRAEAALRHGQVGGVRWGVDRPSNGLRTAFRWPGEASRAADQTMCRG